MSCCPTTYWCVPGRGPTPGTIDEDTGITTPPDGAVGEPFATLGEAADECPTLVSCPECDEPFEIPGGAVGLYLTNLTGTPTFDLPAYTELPGTPVAVSAFNFATYDPAETPNFTRLKAASYGGSCTFGGGMNVIVQAVLAYSGGDWTWTPQDPADGWTEYGNWGFARTFACGEQFDLSEPTYIGRIRYVNAGVDFTYDIYLGPTL